MFYAKLIICSFLFCSYITADDSYWDERVVSNYVHHSEMQRRWALSFLAPHLQTLQGTESILDVGCGDGKISADISRFVLQGHVLGIDPSKAMLGWACRQYSALEYPNLTFQQGGILHAIPSQVFDIIISNCVFHHCLDQPRAFRNCAKLLKPQGKLLVLIPTNHPAWKQARKNVQALERYAVYWKDIEPRVMLTVDEYVELLERAGLQPIRVEKIVTVDPFVNREEFVEFLIGTLPLVVPLDMAHEFYNRLIDEYIRLLPEALRSDGSIEGRFGRVEIEATLLEKSK